MNWKKKLATFSILISISTIVIYLINKFIHFTATLDNLLSDVDGKYYEWRFGKVFYTKKGEGPPLLLVHDLNSMSSSKEWDLIVEKLAQNNSVYTLDLLGCGRSDKPNITYTSFLYVQLITDFIKHIIGNKADVIATGDTCSIVLLACHNDKTIIDKILLTNPSSLSSLSRIPSKQTKILKFIINMPIIGTLIYNILMRKNNIKILFENCYFSSKSNIDDRLVQSYYEAAHIFNAKPKYLFASKMGRYTTASITHCLPLINNSIFVIVGNEESQNETNAMQYKEYTPSIEIVKMEHAKLLPQLELPEKFVEQIKIYFEIDNKTE